MDDLFDILRLLSLVVVVAAVASVVSVFVQEGLRIFFTSRSRVSTVTTRKLPTKDAFTPLGGGKYKYIGKIRHNDDLQRAQEYINLREAE